MQNRVEQVVEGTETASTRRLASLEVLRGVAALLVVLYHAEGISIERSGVDPLGGLFAAGRAGVDLFFVLSGFVIAYVHGADVDRPASLRRYVVNRFTRIYPSMWVVSAFAAATYLAGFGGADKTAKLAPARLAASVLLVAQRDWPLVNVTWTLTYEVFFYALFALCIWRGRIGVAVLAVWQAAVLALALAGVTVAGGAWTLYLRPFCAEFGFGMVCAHLATRVAARRPGPRASDAVLGAAILVGVLVFTFGLVVGASLPRGELAPLPELALFGVSSAAVIVGAAGLELRGRLPRPPATLTALGAASYSIYLVHYPVIALIAAALARLRIGPFDVVVGLGLAGAGVAAGVAFDRYVDHPIRRAFRRSRQPSRGRAATDRAPHPYPRAVAERSGVG